MTRPRAAWTPPPRDGVSASRVAVHGGPWAGVGAFLAARLPRVVDWPERLVQGSVLDAQGRPLAADSPCRAGDLLWYWRALPQETRVPFELDLLHQCEHLVVVDKPHFLPVAPGGRYLQETALIRLKRLLGIDTLVPVHRLDLETAGVLMLSVKPAARNAYHALLRERRAHKVYEAVAPWRADLVLPLTLRHRLEEPTGADFMQMQEVPGDPNAETVVELIAPLPHDEAALGPALAHYRLTPLTGRKHQLRAQLCAAGLPIVGDRIYPRLWPQPAPDAAPDYSLPLQLLARELRFVDPISGEQRCFTSRRRLQALPSG